MDVYLRPQDGASGFVDFKNVAQLARRKPPSGIAQVGKAFRNQMTPGNFIFRTLEFEQMEMEFRAPGEAEEWYRYWVAERVEWHARFGIREEHLRVRAHEADELSHYSSGTSDIEYLFPIGWSEPRGSRIAATTTSPARRRLGHEARMGRLGQRRTVVPP